MPVECWLLYVGGHPVLRRSKKLNPPKPFFGTQEHLEKDDQSRNDPTCQASGTAATKAVPGGQRFGSVPTDDARGYERRETADDDMECLRLQQQHSSINSFCNLIGRLGSPPPRRQ